MLASPRLWGFRRSLPGTARHPQQFNLFLSNDDVLAICQESQSCSKLTCTPQLHRVPGQVRQRPLTSAEVHSTVDLPCLFVKLENFGFRRCTHTGLHVQECSGSLHLMTHRYRAIRESWGTRSQNHYHCLQVLPCISPQPQLVLSLEARKSHTVVKSVGV